MQQWPALHLHNYLQNVHLSTVFWQQQVLLERANRQMSDTRELLEQLESRAGIPLASTDADMDPFEGFRAAMAGCQASMASLHSEGLDTLPMH